MSVDLSDIDSLKNRPGPTALMDTVVPGLPDEERDKLRAACGLVPGVRRRQWPAIARWLDGVAREGGLLNEGEQVKADHVRRWAAKQ